MVQPISPCSCLCGMCRKNTHASHAVVRNIALTHHTTWSFPSVGSVDTQCAVSALCCKLEFIRAALVSPNGLSMTHPPCPRLAVNFPPVLGLKSYFLDVPEMSGWCSIVKNGVVRCQLGHNCQPINHDMPMVSCGRQTSVLAAATSVAIAWEGQ